MPIKMLISSARDVLLRPKGEMSRKNDPQLNAAINLDERLSTWCGGLVVIGLIIEIGLAWFFPPLASPGAPGSFHAFVDRWGSVIADTLVALGVIGEIFFARHVRRGEEELRRRSNKRVEDAEIELAKATLQAAEAQNETEILRAHTTRQTRPRMPNPDLFAKELEGAAAQHVELMYNRHIPDAFSCALSIAVALQRAGWDVEPNPKFQTTPIVLPDLLPWTSWQLDNPWGIRIAANRLPRHGDPTDPLNALSQAIFKSGAENSINTSEDKNLPDGVLRMVVGAKSVSWPGEFSRAAKENGAAPNAISPAADSATATD